MRPFVAASLVLVLATSRVPSVSAAWSNSPYTNLAVCSASYNQQYTAIVSDEAGGAIVTWSDYRTGVSDIYAQHVLASGAVDPAWPVNGVALCAAANSQLLPMIVSDGAGGAIAAWEDSRAGATSDVYAQRVLASGAVDPSWPVGGRALCTATGYQGSVDIVSDGAGGAIVSWVDGRVAGTDIYAQHVLASGAVDAAWPADGRALCTATDNQDEAAIASDGAGGAIVTWRDFRGGSYPDIYARRVLASGGLTAPSNGVAVCTAAYSLDAPQLVPDGLGGAIITWHDNRTGTGSTDVYAQRVLASGAVDATWPADGRAVCTAAGSQFIAQIVTDGAGGAILAWTDSRGASPADIYAHHVLASGAVDPAWPADGRAVCAATGNQQSVQLDSDGAGGAFVAWHDYRGGSYADVYAQHVLASGAVDATWPADGRALCVMSEDQTFPQIVADGAGGVIVSWTDERAVSHSDVYAQRVGRHGYLGSPEPEIVSVEDVPNDQGGQVKVSWNASYPDLVSDPEFDYYDVLRSVPSGMAAAMQARGAHVHALAGGAGAARPGDLLTEVAGSTTYYWEYLAALTTRHYLSGYGYIAPTLGDSIAGSNPSTAFMIVARNSTLTMYWPSRPDSGYSVDDLAPAAPAPLTGQYAAGTTSLHWDRNTEADLTGYRLYRGTAAGFFPGPGNLVAALADTGYADPAGAPRYYKLTAVDVHGNESPVAALSPEGTAEVDDPGAPDGISFALAGLNPAAAETRMRFELPRAAVIRLAVYDACGRLVRVLGGGGREAGAHTERWDLRNAAGRPVGAGLYFARLEVEGRAFTHRIAVMR